MDWTAALTWTFSMPIRKDNRENEPGIEMLLEIQFVNVANCKPVVGAYIDAWHANATGVSFPTIPRCFI